MSQINESSKKTFKSSCYRLNNIKYTCLNVVLLERSLCVQSLSYVDFFSSQELVDCSGSKTGS